MIDVRARPIAVIDAIVEAVDDVHVHANEVIDDTSRIEDRTIVTEKAIVDTIGMMIDVATTDATIVEIGTANTATGTY